MNSNFKTKLLLKLANKKANKGFTLIELLVVVIIVGVLAAVALPNLLGQVGKGRETAAKTSVGAINRAQQAYHFERQTFTPALTDGDLEANNVLGVIVKSDIYDFDVPAGDAADTTVTAATVDGEKNGIRGYAGSVNFDPGTGNYGTVICQSDEIADAADTGDAAAGTCAAGSTVIK